MKHKHATLGMALMALATIVLAGSCDLFGRSADATIKDFQGYLDSSDRSQLYTILDSGASMYNQAKAASYWDGYFTSGSSFTIMASASGTSASGTITSSDGMYSNTPISFTFSKDGFDYVISRITVTGLGSVYY